MNTKFTTLKLSPAEKSAAACFSSFQTVPALVASLDQEILSVLSDPKALKKVAEACNTGKLLPDDFYVHESAINVLPSPFRVLAYLASQVYLPASFDLVKFNLSTTSVSFLKYRSFLKDAHPSLQVSYKIDVRRRTYKTIDYSRSANPPILHRKETFLSPAHPFFARFKRLSLAEEKLGLLSSSKIGNRQNWVALLEKHSLRVVGHKIERC